MGLRRLHHRRAVTLGMLAALVAALSSVFKTRAALQLENLALRHQLGVLHRSVKKPKLTPLDRLLWAWLCGVWDDWRSALIVVKPETVIAWHRKGFRLFWTWKVGHGQPGRPSVPKDIRDLIRLMSRANPTWGAPRIHGELLKLGMNIGETSVSKYLVRHRKPPSQTWRTFLENHGKNLVSADFFTVPTPSASKSSTYSWCWLMTDAGSSTSASRPTPPQNGPSNNSATPSLGTPRHAIFYGIATASSVTTSASRSRIWPSRKCCRRHGHPGSEPTLNA